MTIEELKQRKKELGYTNAMIAKKTGLSIGAVQKVFSGETGSPRYDTVQKLEKLLMPAGNANAVKEGSADFYRVKKQTGSEKKRVAVVRKQIVIDDDDRWPRQGDYTLDDYYAIPDDVRVELIDGIIYNMTAPTRAHQTIAFQICRQLFDCIKENAMPCVAYIAPLDVRLDCDEKTMVQPDVIVLCHNEGNKERIEGAPEFVTEVLSPSTRWKDCIIKLEKYKSAGVREYWIVDPDNEKVLVYDFESENYPRQYDFADKIPVAISKGKCEIDFAEIKTELERFS